MKKSVYSKMFYIGSLLFVAGLPTLWIDWQPGQSGFVISAAAFLGGLSIVVGGMLTFFGWLKPK